MKPCLWTPFVGVKAPLITGDGATIFLAPKNRPFTPQKEAGSNLFQPLTFGFFFYRGKLSFQGGEAAASRILFEWFSSHIWDDRNWCNWGGGFSSQRAWCCATSSWILTRKFPGHRKHDQRTWWYLIWRVLFSKRLFHQGFLLSVLLRCISTSISGTWTCWWTLPKLEDNFRHVSPNLFHHFKPLKYPLGGVFFFIFTMIFVGKYGEMIQFIQFEWRMTHIFWDGWLNTTNQKHLKPQVEGSL